MPANKSTMGMFGSREHAVKDEVNAAQGIGRISDGLGRISDDVVIALHDE